MPTPRCLYCYQPLASSATDFHPRCSRKIFGQPAPPALPYAESQLAELAAQVIRSQIAVTGVQPKLSLEIAAATRDAPQRFTIVGLWGGYILKPPTPYYPWLPEVEDVTMHLAELAKINTVPHSLIRLADGKLAYITRRIDRQPGGKLHMEDMCQLTQRLTENKYDGSHEQIAKALLRYSATPLLDLVNYYEIVLFSFLTGNADMHLKNFSLLSSPERGYTLAPAYDLVASALVNPADTEELALTLNGKKKRLKRADFEEAFRRAKLEEKVARTLFNRFGRLLPEWNAFIERSFLPEPMKREYQALIAAKAQQLELD